jgi:hypothetical protein
MHVILEFLQAIKKIIRSLFVFLFYLLTFVFEVFLSKVTGKLKNVFDLFTMIVSQGR